jgi:hypothetical protein
MRIRILGGAPVADLDIAGVEQAHDLGGAFAPAPHARDDTGFIDGYGAC